MKPELERTPMPDVTTIKLRPCPFCDSPATLSEKGRYAQCSRVGCIAHMGWELIAAWNHRPEEDRLRKSSHSVSQCCPMSERLQTRVEELVEAATMVRDYFGTNVFGMNLKDFRQKYNLSDNIDIQSFAWGVLDSALSQACAREAAAEASAKGVKGAN